MDNRPALARLAAAFRDCRYLVEVTDGEIELRVGQRQRALDALLRAQGARFAALLTAANPGARVTPTRWNASRHRALLAMLRRRGLQGRPTRAVDPLGLWPDEPGLLVPGITRSHALVLAHHFRQRALLWCAVGHAPQVLWT